MASIVKLWGRRGNQQVRGKRRICKRFKGGFKSVSEKLAKLQSPRQSASRILSSSAVQQSRSE